MSSSNDPARFTRPVPANIKNILASNHAIGQRLFLSNRLLDHSVLYGAYFDAGGQSPSILLGSYCKDNMGFSVYSCSNGDVNIEGWKSDRNNFGGSIRSEHRKT